MLCKFKFEEIGCNKLEVVDMGKKELVGDVWLMGE